MAPALLKTRLKLLLDSMPRGSKAALAKACKVKGPSVSNWLSGKTQTIEGENLINAARFFNVNPEWLATGKGPRERFTSAEVNGTQQLGETVTNALAHPPSQPATLNPDTVFETLSLLVHDETVGGRYSPRDKATRFAELYRRIVADGGVRLSLESNEVFLGEVRARAKQLGVGGGEQ